MSMMMIRMKVIWQVLTIIKTLPHMIAALLLHAQPYKQHQQMDRNKAGNIWTELKGAIDEIFKKNASNLSFEHLYR